MKKISSIGWALTGLGLIGALVISMFFTINFGSIQDMINQSPLISFGNRTNNKTFEKTYTHFTNLEIDVDAGSVYVKTGDTYSLTINYCDSCNFRFTETMDGNTLKIESNQKSSFIGLNFGYHKPVFTLTVPKDVKLDDVYIDSDLGILELKQLNIHNLDLETKMGDISVEDSQITQGEIDASLGDLKVSSNFKSLRLKLSMGSVNFKGTVETLDLDNAMGDSNLYILGSIDDYYIEAKSSLGNLQINEYYEDGIDNKIELNTHLNTHKHIKLNNSMGNIDVQFSD